MNKTCSTCRSPFACAAQSESGCWCETYPPQQPSNDADCLCPECLGKAVAARNQETALVEGEDYYLEGAALVFTAAHHLRRGYCCGNGCRHCPY